MTKSFELVLGLIHSNKPPLRHLIDRPRKPQKHRYERRKIRECLRLADWMGEA